MLESPQRRSADGGRKLHQRAALRFAQVGHHLRCIWLALTWQHKQLWVAELPYLALSGFCCTAGLT